MNYEIMKASKLEIWVKTHRFNETRAATDMT